MAFERSDFSRVATRDLRSSMAEALALHLEDMEFDSGAGVMQLAQVFTEWPSYIQRYIAPSACVLPGTWVYADAYLTPTLMESTWEPQTEDGTPTKESGYGLYKVAEMEVVLEASFRTSSTAEREAIILAAESIFQAPLLLMDEQKGARNAVILEMPSYYGLCARFALTGGRVIDDEDRAMRENRDAVLTIKAEATQVVVGPVSPLNVKVKQVVGGPEVDIDNC